MLEELKKMPPAPSAALARVKRKPTTKKKSQNLIKVGQEASINVTLYVIWYYLYSPWGNNYRIWIFYLQQEPYINNL